MTKAHKQHVHLIEWKAKHCKKVSKPRQQLEFKLIFGPNLCHTGVIDRYSRCLCWVRALECHHWCLRWVAMAICSVVLEARVHTAIITASFPPPTISVIPTKQKSTKN